MSTVVSDLRFALRALLKHRALSAVVIGTVALGVGASTAIFSAVNAALLRPLPFHDADALYLVWGVKPSSALPQLPLSLPNFLDVRERARSFESMAVWTSFTDSRFSVTGGCADCEPEKVQYAVVSSNLFSVLGARPEIGRAFSARDDDRASARGVIVSRRLWDRRFGGRTSADGATITLDGTTYDVIGVMPPTFRFVNAPRAPDVWLPLGLDPFRDRVYARGASALGVVARLRHDVPAAQAQRELSSIAAELERAYPSFNRGWTLHLVSLRVQATQDVRDGLLILLGAVALVLLIGCANIANLLLARAASRRQEIAIRSALGASRRQIISQILVESVLLALVGGAAGLLVAAWLIELPGAVPLAAPSAFVPYAAVAGDVRIDGTVLAFSLGVALVSGVLFGLAPALRASHTSLYAALAARNASTTDPGRLRTRQALVIAEVALAMTLLVGAGLLLRSFARLRSVDPGFRPDGVLAVDVDLPRTRYATPTRQAQFYTALAERIAALPSVTGVGGIEQLPLSGPQQTTDFRILGAPPPQPGDEPEAAYASVMPGYFAAMGTALRRGRVFTPADGSAGPRVVLINETMARQFWPNDNPVGKRVALSIEALRFDRRDAPPRLDFDDAAREIVGVVADVRSSGVALPALPAMYVPLAQRPVSTLSLVVWTSGDAQRLVAPIRAAVRMLDPDQPLSATAAMSDVVAGSVQEPRDRTRLLAAFATLALLLAAIGVYGVIAYGVAARTREIGVRVALGADAREIARLVVGGAAGLAGIGIALGLAGGVVASRLLASLLYGVGRMDGLTFAGATLVILGTALIAAWVPARRATRVDPAAALRD